MVDVFATFETIFRQIFLRQNFTANFSYNALYTDSNHPKERYVICLTLFWSWPATVLAADNRAYKSMRCRPTGRQASTAPSQARTGLCSEINRKLAGFYLRHAVQQGFWNRDTRDNFQGYTRNIFLRQFSALSLPNAAFIKAKITMLLHRVTLLASCTLTVVKFVSLLRRWWESLRSLLQA